MAGFGYHGDVIVAWDEGVLDQATKTCGPDANAGDVGASGITSDCPVFEINSVEEQQACKIEIPPEIKEENVAGPASVLPGNVAIQSGPAYATEGSGSPVKTFGSAASSFALPTSSSTTTASSTPEEQGNVFHMLSSSSSITPSSSTPSPTLYPSTTTLVQAVKQADQPSSTTTPAPVAPAVNAPVGLQLSTVTTTWYTNGQEAYEVVVVAEEVTVTVAAGATPAPQKAKREHEHLAGHKRHSRRHQHHAGRAS